MLSGTFHPPSDHDWSTIERGVNKGANRPGARRPDTGRCHLNWYRTEVPGRHGDGCHFPSKHQGFTNTITSSCLILVLLLRGGCLLDPAYTGANRTREVK